jgi:hypothetical protein
MNYKLVWTPAAEDTYRKLSVGAKAALVARKESETKKSSRAEGLFKQVSKCVHLLQQNPRHPGLHTHEFESMSNPYQKDQKVLETYVQHKTPGAYRVFWCYGPRQGELTTIAITPNP